MKKWILPLILIAVAVFTAALFLTPSFTYHCSEELFACMEQAQNASFFSKIGAHLICVYYNVLCVLGGLFV